MKLIEKLIRIQTELKAPKNLYNSFGNYKYRNAEGICEAAKPFLAREGVAMFLSDSIEAVGDRIYVKATARVTDGTDSIEVSAYAREADTKKGMDDSQITGTASSYARKYALNGLFLLDDTKDADTDEYKKQIEARTKQQKDEDDAEKLGKEKITDVMVKALEQRCKNDGVPVEFLLKSYKVESLSDMTNKMYRNANDHWKQIVDGAKA